jgi:pimeloyl-ACP methyl ester carboxylesterase
MPYSYNDGVRLHYEVEGEGPPLVLQHGFTDSLLS